MNRYMTSILAATLGALTLQAAPQAILVEDNPAPFARPSGFSYYEAQDLSLPAVRKMGKKAQDILAKAGNPAGELEKVGALSSWVAENLRHSHFDKRIKMRNSDPKYDTFKHDPGAILAYAESFMPFNPDTWANIWCTHQNDVLIGLLNGIGLHGRIHNITGHVGGEYYSPQYRKWIYIDSTFNEYYVDSQNLPMPLSTLEMIDLTKAGQQGNITAKKFGPYPAQTYIAAFPKGFDVAFMPKMWMATFDQNEAKNTKANLINYGAPLADFQKPYPKTALRDAVDFPLGLIRLNDAVIRGDGWVLTELDNCMPHFAYYEFRNGEDGAWTKLAKNTDAYNGNTIPVRYYRGIDNAGFASLPVKITVGDF